MKKRWEGFPTQMRRVLYLAGTLLLLEAKVAFAGAPEMTPERYPKVDGSLACVPLMEALIQEVTGCDAAAAEESLNDFSNTNPSYTRLANGSVDLILSYEAAGETKESVENWEDLNLKSVGRDALIFIVNADNPVESLTSEQIKKIYTGEITNWSEVGGEDLPIKAFQRREDSGSQTLMRLLLMGDTPISPQQYVVIPGMEGLLDAVLAYDNTANALGYSVYYYVTEMNAERDLKILAVDGVLPSAETIGNGAYALSNPFYCGTGPSDNPEAQALQSWLVGPEGQAFVESCGYVPYDTGGQE